RWIMYTIILASHKNLAKGMKETVEYILGPAPFIKVMTAYTDDNYDIEKDTNILLDGTDKVLVITDLLGGSVNNHWMNYVYEKKLTKKITVIAGMTLSLIMELSMNIEDYKLREKISMIIAESQKSIINCSELMEVEDND
ncbi:TPA: PTS sugar transporter subunit IIA, partial [Enterococcus faecium]